MKIFCLFSLLSITVFCGIVENQAQTPITPRRGVTVSSPTGVRPVPDEIRNVPRRVPDGLTSDQNIPDDVVYPMMFKQLVLMNQTDGKQGVNCRGELLLPVFRKDARLSDKQYKNLLKIANETNTRLDELAQKAVPILREFRAKMMSTPATPGMSRPAPPPELEALNNQKLELIETAIEKIKTSFGEKDFFRFSEFVDQHFRSRITRISVPVLQR